MFGVASHSSAVCATWLSLQDYVFGRHILAHKTLTVA